MNTRDYVNRLLALGQKHGDIPAYGSPEWEALPTTDPRRFAAVVRAAESWRRDNTDEAIAARLTEELAQIDHLTRRRIFDTGIDVHTAYLENRGTP